MKPLVVHRREQLLSIAALAEKADVSTKTVLDIEKGRTDEPRLRTMKKISEALGVPATEISEFAAFIAGGHKDGGSA